jgi:hypothetical protein
MKRLSLLALLVIHIACTTNPSMEKETPIVTETEPEPSIITVTRNKDIEGYKIRVTEMRYTHNDSIIKYDSLLIETFNNVIPDDTIYHFVRYKNMSKVLIDE